MSVISRIKAVVPRGISQVKSIGENVRSLRVKFQPLEHALPRTRGDLHWADRNPIQEESFDSQLEPTSFEVRRLKGSSSCANVRLSVVSDPILQEFHNRKNLSLITESFSNRHYGTQTRLMPSVKSTTVLYLEYR
jgi:hypothetical protein